MAARSRELMAEGRREAADQLLAQAIELQAAELPADFRAWRPQRISDHFAAVMFTGGPASLFESVGRASTISMIEHGLYPDSSVLDIGCGSLRLGYWLINFLQPGCYHGIEPENARVRWGLNYLVGPDVAEAKRPRFDDNVDLDFAVFDRNFDFFVARSIWTHAARRHIVTMLDGFRACAAPDAVFLASYVPTTDGTGYEGDEWVGMPLVEHSFAWIAAECEHRGLAAREVPVEINGQVWVRVEHAAAAHRPLPRAPTSGDAKRPKALGQRLRGLLAAD